MNADLYQPHVGPNTAPKHHPASTTNGNGTAVAASHHLAEHPQQETLHSNPVMNLDNILMELEHGGKDLLKIAHHHHHAPKCGQDLRTEIRAAAKKQQQGQQLLKKTTCSSKQSLLSQVRTTKSTQVLRHYPTHTNTKKKLLFSQALLQDIRAWHNKITLKKQTAKIHHPKQALLSEIRYWAGRCTDTRMRPRQVIVWRHVTTSTDGNKKKLLLLNPVQTMCRDAVWREVRAMHGHAYKHLPPKEKGLWMMDIHSSNNNQKARLTQTKTMNKQSMLSQIRSFSSSSDHSSSSLTLLNHVSIKSTQMLLSQVRLVAGDRHKMMKMAKLHHCRSETVDRYALMADIRAMHGHAYNHLPIAKEEGWMMDIHKVACHVKKFLHPTQTIDKRSLFSQVRATGFHRTDWKHHGVEPKSIIVLLSQVRSVHGHTSKHHAAMTNRRALMSDIRMMHGIAPKHLPLKHENCEWMMEIHALPLRQLHHHARTLNKQSLLSEIRISHTNMQSVMPKSIQMLLSVLRATHGHVIKPKTLHGTVYRSALLSDVRACHGHSPIHLPKNKDSLMMDIHSPRKLDHVKTMNKQALFTEIRAPISSSGTMLHHVTPKSIQMILSQTRMMHNQHKMKHHSTKNHSALLSDVRACHGHAPKHLPKDSWMMEIQRPLSDLHHAKTMNKQELLSEIRTSHPRMHHVVFLPKSYHNLMMQLRSMHGAKHTGPLHLQHCDPVDRQGLMTDIRATSGHAIA